MVRKNFNDPDEVSGYKRYWQDPKSEGIFLPVAIAADIAHTEAAKRVAAIDKEALTTSTRAVRGGKPLPNIRINTDMDIGDTTKFAKRLLADVVPPLLLSAQLSEDLLVAVLMVTAYRHPNHGMSDVLYHVVDPLWDSPKQLLSEFKNERKGIFAQKLAAAWFEKFDKKIDTLWRSSHGALTALFQAANLHWSNALNAPKTKTKPTQQTVGSGTPNSTIQVFDPQALEQAVVTIADMNQERQAAGARILEQARANSGRRTLPDAQQAGKNLEAKKLEFENLVEPIERLQVDLVLAAAMRAHEFRISPILLLGEPGIGKTYLASQVAQALGVPSEKISAGGAQGGFQLTGSHSSWMAAKPGLVATLLARSTVASPMLIIDEVDKISDSRYPFLPVLLDLLDAGTAKRFRDEYFEMDIDASRIVVVLTANDISKVPPPLLSRVEVFTVPAPEPAQRLRIIKKTVADLGQRTNRQISLAPGAAERLAERIDIDLRQLHRTVTAAFSKAVQNGVQIARIETPLGNNFVRFNLRSWKPAESTWH